MPHSPKPFYKHKRDSWYVEVDRVQHLLGRHPEDQPPPHKRGKHWDPPPAILADFYKKMAELQAAPKQPQPKKELPSDGVLSVIEKFLVWCHGHRKEETYEWYRWRLQRFADSIPSALTVAQLRHYHLDDCLKNPGWSSGMRHGVARAVIRAILWAKKKGHTDINPLADYEKPRPGRRKQIVSPEEFAVLLALAGGPEFHDLLSFTWETGARPQETVAVEARHVEQDSSRIVFPPDEAKGDQWPRVIYLTDTALAIVRRLTGENPSGPIFRNSDGVPWTSDAVNCAFARLRLRLGMQEMARLAIEVPPVPHLARNARRKLTPTQMKERRAEKKVKVRERLLLVRKLAKKHGKKYSLYTLRHSWATHALARGVDALTVAVLLGHRDPSTLAKVYSHLTQKSDYLREAARKAVG